jgi:hypothetical protein
MHRAMLTFPTDAYQLLVFVIDPDIEKSSVILCKLEGIAGAAVLRKGAVLYMLPSILVNGYGDAYGGPYGGSII